MKKAIIIISIILTAAAVLTALIIRNTPERRISRFVRKHERELLEIAEAELSKEHHHKSDEKYLSVQIDGAFEGDHPMVQFYSFGSGLVPSSSYYGFYYSPDDVPLPFQNSDGYREVTDPDEKSGSDTAHYQGEGDNGGLTKKIIPYWYYYKAWF